ncbi:MAG: hypothetical protein KGJ77_08255 [Acidobacteriota bacterium]|nr:hypothetical protein [Acidobacteriota bacterium]
MRDGGVSVGVEEQARGPAAVTVGSDVCVWNPSLESWTVGFSVAEVLPDGFRLRRRSDGHVFDHVFAPELVQAERRRGQAPGFVGTDHDRRADRQRW